MYSALQGPKLVETKNKKTPDETKTWNKVKGVGIKGRSVTCQWMSVRACRRCQCVRVIPDSDVTRSDIYEFLSIYFLDYVRIVFVYATVGIITALLELKTQSISLHLR